ncbi:MAG: NADH-quinone oxidoreductase subunit N [Planctomycetota bacterium]
MSLDLVTMLGADAPNVMVEKLRFLGPEIVLFLATCAVMVLGLSPQRALRQACALVAGGGLLLSAVVAQVSPVMETSLFPQFLPYAKTLIAAVGVLMVLLVTGTIDRDFEAEIDRGRPFDAIRSNRGEFYAFLLFSLTGLMLVVTADDLVWLFLALELTSLPTYVMVSISTKRARSQEAGVKYFFLGALGAAVFLYGFAMLYGATGTTMIWGDGTEPGIAQALQVQMAAGGLSPIAMLGIVLSILGICFKIAAVPMHFYTPDVYEGAASPVSAFLAFVPKAAGIIALIYLLSTVGWQWGAGEGSLPDPVRVLLWTIAALTMTVGNVLAILQTSVKRVLAYSSIAHSGYMLVGLIAGPGDGGLTSNGLAASMFYLLCYGFMNLGTFAVLACLERDENGERVELETFDDLRGLCATRPWVGWTMVLCSASLLGVPPLLGFVGKLFLFTSAISAGEIALVIVLGVNSAVAAFYYLRLIGAPMLESPTDHTRSLQPAESPWRVVAGVLSAASVIVLVPFSGVLIRVSSEATSPVEITVEATASAAPIERPDGIDR